MYEYALYMYLAKKHLPTLPSVDIGPNKVKVLQ